MNFIFVNSEDLLEEHFNIRKIVFMDEQGVSLEDEIDVFDELECKSCDKYIVQKNNKTIGAFRCTFENNNNIIHIQRLCLLKNERGKNYGRMCLEYIENKYKEKYNINTFILGAQCQAIPFYEKCGYKVNSDTFMDAGIPHKNMIKEIR